MLELVNCVLKLQHILMHFLAAMDHAPFLDKFSALLLLYSLI